MHAESRRIHVESIVIMRPHTTVISWYQRFGQLCFAKLVYFQLNYPALIP